MVFGEKVTVGSQRRRVETVKLTVRSEKLLVRLLTPLLRLDEPLVAPVLPVSTLRRSMMLCRMLDRRASIEPGSLSSIVERRLALRPNPSAGLFSVSGGELGGTEGGIWPCVAVQSITTYPAWRCSLVGRARERWAPCDE